MPSFQDILEELRRRGIDLQNLAGEPDALSSTINEPAVRRMFGLGNDPIHKGASAQQKYGQTTPQYAQMFGLERPRVVEGQPVTGELAAPRPGYEIRRQPISGGYGDLIGDDELKRGSLPTRLAAEKAMQISRLPESQRMYNQIQEAENRPADIGYARKKPFLKRLGSGLWNAIKEGDERGLIGAAIQGFDYGFDPKSYAEGRKQRDIAKLQRMFGVESQREQIMADTAKKGYQAQQEGLQAQQLAAKSYIETAMYKGHLTDEEIDHLRTAYGLDIPDKVDKGEYEETTINGIRYIRRKSDPRWIPNPTAPPELGEQYYDTSVPGQPGKTVPAKPGQVLSTAVGMAQAQARGEERKIVREEKAEEQKFKTEAEWRDAVTKAKAQKANAETRLRILQQGRQDLINQTLPTNEIDTQIAAASGDIAEADVLINQPKPNFSKQTKSKRRQKFSEAEARRYFKSQGLSDADINARIQQGKSEKSIY